MTFNINTNVISADQGFVSDADPAGRTLNLYCVSGREWGDDDDAALILAAYNEDEAIAMHKRILNLEDADDDDERTILTHTLCFGEVMSEALSA